MTDEIRHPTAGRRRRHKSPAAVPVTHDLHLPSLPDHFRTDVDGPSCSNDEKGAMWFRSTSTTPRSVRGTNPDDYDRAMGVTSVGSRELWGLERKMARKKNLDGVAHNNSKDLNEFRGMNRMLNAHLGVDQTLRGYGSASLLECSGRMGAQPHTSAPAICHSEGGQKGTLSNQTDLLQFSRVLMQKVFWSLNVFFLGIIFECPNFDKQKQNVLNGFVGIAQWFPQKYSVFLFNFGAPKMFFLAGLLKFSQTGGFRKGQWASLFWLHKKTRWFQRYFWFSHLPERNPEIREGKTT